jgi:hypothetical protein
MKKYLFVAILLFFGGNIIAQTATDYVGLTRSVLKKEKKVAVMEAMQLTDKEGEVFWPLYEEYNSELYKVQNKRVAVIKEYAKNFKTMTDEEADKLWTDFMKFRDDLLNLQEEYFEKFKEILPAVKVVRYFQFENKIDMRINAKMAVDIPLLKGLTK